jgi:GTPase SAR1 family protein
MPRNYKLKMIIGGASGSGKTSFLSGKVINDNEFKKLGVEFKPIECVINNGDTYQFICWDPKVRDRYRFLFPVFCRGVSCAILCFDLSDRSSFDELSYWIKLIKNNGILNGVKIPIVLLGTKIDLEDRKVCDDEISHLLEQYDLDGIFFTSIYDKKFKKTHEAIFKTLIKKIEPFYQIEDFSIYIPREDNKFKEFVDRFSICPICSQTNHYDNLKNFYFSREPDLVKLKDLLLDLMDKSDDFDDLYYNDIKIGIPCCDCFDKYFRKE